MISTFDNDFELADKLICYFPFSALPMQTAAPVRKPQGVWISNAHIAVLMTYYISDQVIQL
jgi:hypothetical protein